jgi:hypothetical protein
MPDQCPYVGTALGVRWLRLDGISPEHAVFTNTNRQSNAQPELNQCFGLFTRSGIESAWIIGHSESMRLFTNRTWTVFATCFA